MSRTEVSLARSDSPELTGREPESRRALISRRRRMRLRRTMIGALTLLMVGAVLARWAEDPGDIVAAGASRAGPLADAPRTGALVPAVTTPVRPAASTTSAVTPATSATPHADGDSEADGSTAPVANPAKKLVPASGSGTVVPVAIPNGPVKATGRTVTYSVEVEGGLPVVPAEVAAVVHSVLADTRGWQTKDDVRFVPVSPQQLASGAHVDVRVTLASPTLTAKLCAPLDVSEQQVSCWNGGRSVLNLTRWMLGSQTYGTDLTAYRVYLVNHEVGHGLGHMHVRCPAPGQPSPVMVQQTKSLEGCVAWPFPTAP